MNLMPRIFLFLAILSSCSFPAFAQTTTLWGFMQVGGDSTCGVLFEYDPTTKVDTKRHDFSHNWQVEGAFPGGRVVELNGKLYGTTSVGGSGGKGVLFEYDPSGNTYTVKYNFTGTISNGGYYHPTITVYNNKIYGMTRSGGSNGVGVIYMYDPSTNIYSVKHSFDGTNGSLVSAGSHFLQEYNGKLYGLTMTGGNNDLGVIFEFDPASDTYTKKFDFDNVVDGIYPPCGFTVYNNKLYAYAVGGDSSALPFPARFGVIFEYDPLANTYTRVAAFDGANTGGGAHGAMAAFNSKLYGLNTMGGGGNQGTLFEFDPATKVITNKYSLGTTNNSVGQAYGYAMIKHNNLLYGMSYGGALNNGLIFAYDPTNNGISVEYEFTGPNGGSGREPAYSLTPFTRPAAAVHSSTVLDGAEIYPNPVQDGLLHIDFKGASSLSVTNTLGNVVYSGKPIPTLNVSKWAPGNYYLHLEDKDNAMMIGFTVR